MEGSDFVFDSADLLLYKLHKISLNESLTINIQGILLDKKFFKSIMSFTKIDHIWRKALFIDIN